MTTAEKIQYINEVLQEYFDRNPGALPIPAKDFMPQFIKAGIFTADHRNGLPIRNLLCTLDVNRQLGLLPYVIAERKTQNTSWFFSPTSSAPEVVYLQKEKQKFTSRKNDVPSITKPRSHSDECYVLDLCDEIFGLNSVRQHRFPFLVGDPNTAGICTLLPVDAWYESLKLVIEYNERQHTEAVKLFDRRMTVSGVTRGEQRSIYDKRKLEVLPKHDMTVLVLSYSDFQHDSTKRLLRLDDQDRLVLLERLKRYIKTIP